MKLVSFVPQQRGTPTPARVGIVIGNALIDATDEVEALPLPPALWGQASGMLRLLQAGPEALARLDGLRQAGTNPLIDLDDVQLLAPIPRPGKIIAVGRNYTDHVHEIGGAAPTSPRLIAKLPSSVVGPGAKVDIPPGIGKLDFEVELAAVIGTRARHVEPSGALQHIAGYLVLNDLSAREFQFDVSPPQTTFAKSMDGFCPIGPWLVTTDEIPDPQALRLRCWVNGTLMQDAQTNQMIHSVAEIVAYTSRYMTLEPGDILATGTPSGVGVGRSPAIWLRPGDQVRLEVQDIGVLEHTIG